MTPSNQEIADAIAAMPAAADADDVPREEGAADADEEYQTSYSRSAKPRIRRRGGYGTSSASVLEALPAKAEGSSPSAKIDTLGDDDILMGLGDDDVMMGLGAGVGMGNDDFAMSMDDDFDVNGSSSLFAESQGNDGDSEDGEEDGSVNDNDSTGEAASDGELHDEIEDERPRGRTKQTKKAMVADAHLEGDVKSTDADKTPAKEKDEAVFPQSQASGYGFSQGESQAQADNTEGGEVASQEEPAAEANLDEGKASTESAGEAPSEPAADAPTEPTEPTSKPTGPAGEPTDSDLIKLVDSLFLAVTDRDAMTVGDINRSVEEHYGWDEGELKKKSRKPMKKLIKGRLTDLITGKVEIGTGNEEEESGNEEMEDEEPFEGDYESEPEENNDNSSDYEEEARPTKKKGTNGKSKKGKKSKKVAFDEDSDASNDGDAEETKPKKKRSKKRASRSKNKGKMAKHLRDRHDKSRRRQLEEARIRREELGHLADDDEANKEDGTDEAPNEEVKAAQGPQLSEEDRKRAMAIAMRFDTDRDELRMKRAEERVGLIDRLRAKRLEAIEAAEIKVEVKTETEAEGEKPKLSFSNLTDREEDNESEEKEPADAGAMVDLDDDDSSDEEESDDDLEIIAPDSKENELSTKTDPKPAAKAKVSVEDLLFGNHNGPRRPDPQRSSKSKVIDPRAAMRSALNAKKVQASNEWLARGLGYKKPEDHIRDCAENESKKRAQAYALQKKINKMEELRRKAEAEGENIHDVMQKEKETMEGADAIAIAAADEARALEALGIEGAGDGEEDDELAVAREMGMLEEPGADNGEEEEDNEDAPEGHAEAQSEIADDNDKPEDMKPEDDTPSVSSPTKETSPGSVVTPPRAPGATNDEETFDASDMADNPSAEPLVDAEESTPDNNAAMKEESSSTEEPGFEPAQEITEGLTEVKQSDKGDEDEETKESTGAEVDDEGTDPTEEEPAEEAGPKKPRNSAWQAILEKEKRVEARQKKLQRKGAGLVDGEAEEEEEEDMGIAGLEDFGFAVEKKNNGDDDDVDVELDQDDLDNVVDDVSDGEGDEEAGEVARLKLQQAEEKKRHKEIMRRMREGYDGRRGGIAGGSARGTLRFDQLVAADDRENAKKLGLLNDDEMFSDDEAEEEGGEKKGDVPDEEEDETAFLDKMLKDRFLNREEEEAIQENFTDDEESEDEAEKKEDGDDDDDDREQDRQAKHFEKRARRNRILQDYEGDSQFSRSRLIDEDVSTQQDLKIMKTSFCRKRSVEGSNLDAKENNCSSKKPKGATTSGSDAPKPASSFLAPGGSLSVALAASRRGAGRKRKTTFLSGKSASFSRSHSTSSSSKSVSLCHVVFVSGESQSATSQLPDASSSSFAGKSRGKVGGASKKASRRGSSLWSKVCSKNFKAN